MAVSKKFERINIAAFISVLLAAVLLGFIVHELVHVALIKKATTITLHFGESQNLISVCCLGPLESANEEIAYFIQFVVTIGWIIVNSNVFREKV
ncbi:MAG TPA: hypothetical protein VFF13_03140 [archaeon]|nr:hypothetical protein [archaeon]